MLNKKNDSCIKKTIAFSSAVLVLIFVLNTELLEYLRYFIRNPQTRLIIEGLIVYLCASPILWATMNEKGVQIWLGQCPYYLLATWLLYGYIYIPPIYQYIGFSKFYQLTGYVQANAFRGLLLLVFYCIAIIICLSRRYLSALNCYNRHKYISYICYFAIFLFLIFCPSPSFPKASGENNIYKIYGKNINVQTICASDSALIRIYKNDAENIPLEMKLARQPNLNLGIVIKNDSIMLLTKYIKPVILTEGNFKWSSNDNYNLSLCSLSIDINLESFEIEAFDPSHSFYRIRTTQKVAQQ